MDSNLRRAPSAKVSAPLMKLDASDARNSATFCNLCRVSEAASRSQARQTGLVAGC
jgi:hypothetical protein